MRRFRRRHFRRRIRRGGRFIRKIRRVAKRTIAKLAETKYADFNTGVSALTGVVTFIDITPTFNLGLDRYAGRIGNKVKYRFLQVDVLVFVQDTTALLAFNGITRARCMLIQPRIPVVNLTGITVFDSATFGTTIWRPADGTAVRIIRDKRFVLQSVTASSNAPNSFIVPQYKKFTWRVRVNNGVQLPEGQTSPLDPRDRYMLIVGYETGNANTSMNVSVTSRLSYIDF